MPDRPRCDYGLCDAPATERWYWPQTDAGEAYYCRRHAVVMACNATNYPRRYPRPEQRFSLAISGDTNGN